MPSVWVAFLIWPHVLEVSLGLCVISEGHCIFGRTTVGLWFTGWGALGFFRLGVSYR